MIALSDPASTRLRPTSRRSFRSQSRALPASAWVLTCLAFAACASTPPAERDDGPSSGTVVASAWNLPAIAEDPLHRGMDAPLHRAEDGFLESAALGDGAIFTEALPSWNVPSGVAFTVDIRAQQADLEGHWSPWLRIGDWATPLRHKDTPTRFQGGKVAVDILEMEKPCRAVQLRFLRTDATSGSPFEPGDVAATVVLTDATQLNRRLAAAAQDPWPGTSMVRVAPRSQRAVGDDIGGRICSPTSVSMVSAFHGADIPTRQMAEILFDPHHDIYGNWNRAVQGPATLGIPGRLVRISSWRVVAEYLDQGRPVVASIRAKEGELRGAPYKKTAGHLLVVTGLGPAGAVHVNDPAASLALDVPRVYQRADMERVWFANGGVAYLFGEGAAEVDPEVSLEATR